MLLTRSRLCPRASPGSSLHLHVLSTPPAFVLSQDQTLREELLAGGKADRHEKLSQTFEGTAVHRVPSSMTGSFSGPLVKDQRVEPGRTPSLD